MADRVSSSQGVMVPMTQTGASSGYGVAEGDETRVGGWDVADSPNERTALETRDKEVDGRGRVQVRAEGVDLHIYSIDRRGDEGAAAGGGGGGRSAFGELMKYEMCECAGCRVAVPLRKSFKGPVVASRLIFSGDTAR
jgi:hypothetical protein